MSAVIWEFLLAMTDEQDISLPQESGFLCAQVQGGTIALWARVNPNKPTCACRIFIVGTGQEIPAGAESYIGTVQLSGACDGLVFHVYAGAKP